MSKLDGPRTLGLQPSFGFGDRLGFAGPGHVAAMRADAGPIRGIFAQQSIREMTRTQRTPQQVMAAATSALQAEQYAEPWGADADHLKNEADVDITAAAGFTFFTIDPSAHVDDEADSYDKATLEQKFAAVRAEVDWLDEYEGKVVRVPDGPVIEFDQPTLQRAAVKYGRAIAHSLKIARHIDAVMTRLDRDYEIELSVDETPQPTTFAEHYVIADQCRQAGVKLVSLAPRYVGDFEKGIDFKGDRAAFEQSLAGHAAIARELGPYKLSLHSGSDKLSIYEAFARITQGMFHVKTAGTSYLEALRAVARHDAKLFSRVVDFSRERFDTDKATYHISATLNAVPPAAHVSDAHKLERLYLDENDGRQILHVTFGSVLTQPDLKREILALLQAEPGTHREVLATHLGKHLAALRRGM